ncbi:hypothetical protein SAMN02910291_00938 [Desulfovibrio desulfuricans]|uniref:Uncharacterized protein n=2 Tax=Desulfovibrio desulfuricans TaxID=876 RepID=A0AA94HRQ5_DESDE|nr:hypothetical protein CNY67_11990 [Desulfovibrio sp. G11]SFW35005.1 hypothetical protein SAMN02910291_00938 [Desulfovibrio desulfuricans]
MPGQYCTPDRFLPRGVPRFFTVMPTRRIFILRIYLSKFFTRLLWQPAMQVYCAAAFIRKLCGTC